MTMSTLYWNLEDLDFVRKRYNIKRSFLDAPISMNSTMWGYINDLTNASWPASLKGLNPQDTINYGLLPIWIDQFLPVDGMDNIVSFWDRNIEE